MLGRHFSWFPSFSLSLGTAGVGTILGVMLLMFTLDIAQAVGPTVLLSDNFDRLDSTEVGPGWVEGEQTGATVSVADNKLFFDDTSDVSNGPLISRSFSPVSTGILQWDFDFDWARTADDGGYELWMQLGDGALMVNPSSEPTRFAGVGVNLRWGSFGNIDQRLAARQDATLGGAVSLTTISVPVHVLITADPTAKTYSVAIDGEVVRSGIGFDNVDTVSKLDTVRFFTNSLDEANFSGRTFDNLIISTGEEGNNTPPVAAAGEDQQVEAGATVTLDGSGSTDADGDSLTYSWNLTTVPAASTASLTGAATASPSFVADLEGTYEAVLVVNDGTVDSAPETVSIVASDAGGNNSQPVAAAGEDQQVETGATVTLDGSGSTDADGDTLTHSWNLTTVPAASTASLTGAETASPSFTPDLAGTYEAVLVVNDGTVDSAPETVRIVVIDVNTVPVAVAGEDQQVETGATVTLDGSGSTDADGDSLTYSWNLTAVPAASTASLTGAATASPSFVADLAGTYEAVLVVNDGTADSATGTVSITAATSATILLNDTFDRPNSLEVGEDWVEVEAAEATVAIADQKLFFAETSDVANRPLVRRAFTQVATGTLQWDFDFDWARIGDESNYGFKMQLGDSALMSDNSPNVGVGVNLIWTKINGYHQSLGYIQDGENNDLEVLIGPIDISVGADLLGGKNTALAVLSGPVHISVVADLGAQTYSVAVDGGIVQSGIPFDTNASLDTVRFFTDSLTESNFSGRSIDNVVIITPANGPPEAEPSLTVHQDPSDGATGLKVGITRLFDPSTGGDASGSLGSFQGQLTYHDPSSNPSLPPGSLCVNILGVREMEIPITSPTIDDIAGVAMFEGSHPSGVSAPTDLGLALTRLTGSANQQCQVDLEVTSLNDVDGNPIAVPTVLSQTLQRGDARSDGVINIADALFIAQYLEGSRDACTTLVDTSCMNSANAASVSQDGPYDQTTIADGRFIAEYLLGLRDEFYNPVP